MGGWFCGATVNPPRPVPQTRLEWGRRPISRIRPSQMPPWPIVRVTARYFAGHRMNRPVSPTWCRIWSARRSRSSSRHGCSSSVCLGSTPILWGGSGRSSARTSTNQPATSALPPWRLTSSRIARMLKRESTSLSNSVF